MNLDAATITILFQNLGPVGAVMMLAYITYVRQNPSSGEPKSEPIKGPVSLEYEKAMSSLMDRTATTLENQTDILGDIKDQIRILVDRYPRN